MTSDPAIKILHVFPSFAVGGQQRRLATLAAAFGPGFSHKVLSLDGDQSAAALFGSVRPAVEALIVEKSGFIRQRNIDRLRTAIAASGADILCTYNFGSIEAVIANRTGPRLPHIHHEDGFGADEAGGRLKWTRSLARRILLGEATIVVPSRTLEQIALRKWGLPAKRVRRIPVGIDIAGFHAHRKEKAGPIIVGSIGALRKEKNFARLIRCFEIASEGRDARLVIYGDGPERQKLIDLASRSKASGMISLPGATSTVAESLRQFDIFAISSDTEQMPTSLIEAMAGGLPALATAVGDIPDMLGDEGRAFLVNPDDENEYAAKLRTLIDIEELRRKLGAENLERARQFDLAPMTQAFKELYLSAAERRR
ncbi:MAG: glycosyltransferase family 4 protein [Pseudomonadota bacterium]